MLSQNIDLSFITSQVVTLTPNRRLAAFLAEYYQQHQLIAGFSVWDSAQIYPLDSWVKQLWDLVQPHIATPYKILSSLEQQIIWEKIILTAQVGADLVEIASTAKQAMSAWNMLLQWDLSLATIISEIEYGSDMAVFKQWAIAYQQLCAANAWLDYNSMLNFLMQHVDKYQQHLPKACYLIEHQELTPQYRKFFNVLASAGVTIVEQQLNFISLAPNPGLERAQVSNLNVCNNISVLPLPDQELEYKAVATWAWQQWQENPRVRLGIVVPDLELCRSQVAAAFTECFPSPAYNISAPNVLAQYGIIDIALLILQLSNNTTINLNDLHKLLHSSFVGGSESEILARAMFAQQIRKDNEPNYKSSHIQQKLLDLPNTHPAKCQNFTNIYLLWLEFIQTLDGNHSTEYWVDKFRKILQLWQWPGEQNININESQLMTCWDLLLQAYKQLDFILQDHNFTQAWKTLHKLALHTPFLPETGEVSIHVLGILEAAGLPFDKVWVMGMHSSAWPRPAAPNPFLPISIQRQFDLPRSSPGRELAVAQALTNTFCRSAATQVIFSFAKLIHDIPTMASRLLTNFAEVEPQQVLPWINNAATVTTHYSAANMEVLLDENAPGYTTTAAVTGGSKALQLQANCPFWAFAEIRLRALPVIRASIGLTPAQRGNLLHNVLAKVWQKIKTKAALSLLASTELDDLLLAYINEELLALQKKRPLTLTQSYIVLETKRMLELIKKWLLHEQQRTEFVVYQVEQQHLCRLGTLNFNLRIDRIDQLTTGEIVIIDYKTGQVQIKDWFGERMQNPQLPMYCLATQLAISSIAFAILRPDSILFKGIAKEMGMLPGVQGFAQLKQQNQAQTWDEQIHSWKSQLTTIAAEFQQGIARVQPASVSTTCRNCHLQSFCRIHERVISK